MTREISKNNFLLFFRRHLLFFTILFAFLIKSIWLYSSYNITHDISVHMNIAQNIYDGHGIKATRIENGTVVYRPELTYGTAMPAILAALNYFTNNIVKADFYLRLLLALSESIILVFIIYKYFDNNKDRFLMTGTLCLYIGHLDRGKTGDYLSLVVVLAIVCLIISRAYQNTNFQPRVLVLALLTLSLPFIKYSASPVILLPLSVHLVNYFFFGRKIFNNHEIKLLSLTSVISVLMLFSLVGSSGSSSFNPARISLLTRIDYFWLHFGYVGDRIWKHFFWNISEYFGYHIPYYTIAQIGTLLIIIALAVLSRSRLSAIKLELTAVATLLILQVGFLVYLTLSREPQSGDWGIDQKIWVFIEEARYYNYLTLLIMVIICFLTFKFIRPLFYALLIFILISSASRMDFWNSRFPYILQKYERVRSGFQSTDENANQFSKEDANVNKIFQW